MFLVRAVVGGAGVRAEDGGGKGMQRGERWPDHGGLCRGQSEKFEFYSQCDGKALKSFQQEYYTICYMHLKRCTCRCVGERWYPGRSGGGEAPRMAQPRPIRLGNDDLEWVVGGGEGNVSRIHGACTGIGLEAWGRRRIPDTFRVLAGLSKWGDVVCCLARQQTLGTVWVCGGINPSVLAMLVPWGYVEEARKSESILVEFGSR